MKEFVRRWSNWWILNPKRKQLDDAFEKELNELIEREVALRIHDVARQSKQLKCGNSNPPCSAKDFFINKVSKINQTFEDEFKAEFNSPELIWDNLLSGAIFWQDIKNCKPEKDGQYLTYIQTGKYESIGFTQYIDGQFVSSFVTHWAFVGRP